MTIHASRPCPICLAKKSNLLFSQKFQSFSAESLLDGYDLVVCRDCGGAYANGIPDQQAFDRYYREMSKYTYSHRDGTANATDAERFQQTVDLVSPHVGLNESIADVGCATGGLLAEFKRRGYSHLIGFDPSSACVESARHLYGLDVRETTINNLGRVAERFDLAILTGVLEHLGDVDSSLALVTKLLKPGGRIYIEVPDASSYDRWYSAPFQFFSMEHVNYFSPISLENLFRRHGFQCVLAERVTRYLSPRAVEPAVAALFTHTGKSTPFTYDATTEPALSKYIEISKSIETRIHQIIADLAKSRKPVAVWGTGTHTLRLLKTSDLAKANIVAFIDSNASYQKKTLQSIPIIPPEKFDDSQASILISSHVAEREIKDQIQARLKWPNPVICLYEAAPTKQPG